MKRRMKFHEVTIFLTEVPRSGAKKDGLSRGFVWRVLCVMRLPSVAFCLYVLFFIIFAPDQKYCTCVSMNRYVKYSHLTIQRHCSKSTIVSVELGGIWPNLNLWGNDIIHKMFPATRFGHYSVVAYDAFPTRDWHLRSHKVVLPAWWSL